MEKREKRLIIATRASALALWQAEFVKSQIEKSFPEVEVKLNRITSRGDKILDKPLALVGGKGHFTKELEDEMLLGNADIAVHSLKDVPTFIPKGLQLVAVTKREEQSDILLSHRYRSFEELPKGAVVGTTSLRRRMQILQRRADLKIKDLRGNINTRLKKLSDGEYDAIVLAYIGLKRLNLIESVPFHQKLDFMIPPMGQASLGIEVVFLNRDAVDIARTLDDEESHICTDIERDFIATIGAGCSAPVAINAHFIDKKRIRVRAMVGYPDGTETLYEELETTKEHYKSSGVKLANSMINRGAKELLERAEKIAFKDFRAERL
jgi:hydroxymethylbilane synthase